MLNHSRNETIVAIKLHVSFTVQTKTCGGIVSKQDDKNFENRKINTYSD